MAGVLPRCACESKHRFRNCLSKQWWNCIANLFYNLRAISGKLKIVVK